MEMLYTRCCGLDVHKSSVSACVLIREGGCTQKKYGRYGAMTRELEELARWLHELGVTHVAMESTGVYWKPMWNVLEGQFQLLLVNAQHIKNVPGRKTDVKDSEWVAELLQHGLLHPSFVPEIRIRDLRDLTRARATLSLMWGLHWAEVSIEPIKAFLYYRLSGRKMPRVECYVALIRARHTQHTKQRILR